MSSLAELIARSLELSEQSRQLVEKSRSILAASRRTLDRGDDDVAGHVHDPALADVAAARSALLPVGDAQHLPGQSPPAPADEQAVTGVE